MSTENKITLRAQHDKKKRKLIRCSKCRYYSDRSYNVVRHAERIHSNRKKRIIKCFACDIQFESKGKFYEHSENRHPGERKSSYTSRMKYGILGRLSSFDPPTFHIDNEKLQEHDEKVRTSERLRQKAAKQLKTIIKKNIERATSIPNMENIPLSYFVQDEGLINYFKKFPETTSKIKEPVKESINFAVKNEEKKIENVDSKENIRPNQFVTKNEIKNEYVHSYSLPIKKRILSHIRDSPKNNEIPILDCTNKQIDCNDSSFIMKRHREFLSFFNFDKLKI